MKTTNYYEQRNNLREAAIADIKQYVSDNGEVSVKNPGDIATQPSKFTIRIVTPYLVIGNASATVVETRTLCLLADMLNQMP